jgi:hypothetical protein
LDEWNLGPNNQEMFQELKRIKPASIGRTQGFYRNLRGSQDRIKREIPRAQGEKIKKWIWRMGRKAAGFISGIEGALRQTMREVSGKQEE